MAKKLYMGNEAFAHAALRAGVRVVAGYPGTPSSELIETIAKERAQGRAEGVYVEWSTNEKAALELVAGAAYTGARTLFTCKMVGLNVASDALLSLIYVGVKGGTVLFVADDPGPISSQTEQDTRRFASFAKLPVLDPSTPEEGCEMMEAAFALSEAYATPVIVRPTTRINHASTFMEFPECTTARQVPPEGFERDSRWVIFPRRAYEAHGEINARLRFIAEDASSGSLARFNPVIEVLSGALFDDAESVGGTACGLGLMGDAATTDPAASNPYAEGEHAAVRLGIVAGGVSAAYVREALRILDGLAVTHGHKLPSYRFMQVGTPYPFPEDAAANFAHNLESIVVFEELDHVIEDELAALAGRRHLLYTLLGRTNGFTRDRGENSVDDTVVRLLHFFTEYGGMDEAFAALVSELPPGAGDAPSAPSPTDLIDPVLPARPPVLCAGCPHRGSFYALKQALHKQEAVFCGDIGCYTLGNAEPLDALDTCLCMGAGITMAQGFAVTEPHKKHVAYIGDSTFFASGMTGIANAVYNQHDITIVVLDNATTAMTGGQHHPGTGITLIGKTSVPIDIEGVLRALGVTCVVKANPFDLEAATKAATRALQHEGPSAVIYEGPCIQFVKSEEPVRIDAEECTGCKKCVTSIGCPALVFDGAARGPKAKRGQVIVDTDLCVGCGLCPAVCPFDAIIAPSEGLQGAFQGDVVSVSRQAARKEGTNV